MLPIIDALPALPNLNPGSAHRYGHCDGMYGAKFIFGQAVCALKRRGGLPTDCKANSTSLIIAIETDTTGKRE